VTTRVLFIEDDDAIRMALRMNLEDDGYDVVEAHDGEMGLDCFEANTFDVVLIDLLLPGMHGLEVCRRIRQKSVVPIIVVTAQSDTHDVVAGLEAGADDYITKPIAPKELSARIRAILRRVDAHRESPQTSIQMGDLEINASAGEVRKAGVPLSLTKTEFQILVELADRVGQVVTKETLLEQVWGYDYLGDSRLVDTQIYRLRAKIEDNPSSPVHLVTVRGLGYKFLA
jgi:two-component system, OmpR family, response regulator MtrA